jgi:surface-adhesin protein E
METIMQIQKFKVLILVFIFLSVITETGIAADWVKVGKNSEMSVYIDTLSLQRDGQKVKIWEQYVFTHLQALQGSKSTYEVVMALKAYRCDVRTGIILQLSYYTDATSNKPFANFSFPDNNSDYKNIGPDSMANYVFKFVCREAAPK